MHCPEHHQGPCCGQARGRQTRFLRTQRGPVRDLAHLQGRRSPGDFGHLRDGHEIPSPADPVPLDQHLRGGAPCPDELQGQDRHRDCGQDHLRAQPFRRIHQRLRTEPLARSALHRRPDQVAPCEIRRFISTCRQVPSGRHRMRDGRGQVDNRGSRLCA